MSRTARNLALLAPLLALAACQKPDVGARCTIEWGSSTPAPTPSTVASDFFESGNVGCDDQICIVSPAATGTYATCAGTACGYCSKPCVSDADCYRSDTGLVCRQMVLDPAFLAELDPATREKYLAQIAFSSYCAVPR